MITKVNIKGNGYPPVKCIHNTNMYEGEICTLKTLTIGKCYKVLNAGEYLVSLTGDDGVTRAYNKRYFDTLKVRTSNHLKDFK